MSVAAPCLRAGLCLRSFIGICSLAVALSACSAGSSRFDAGFGYSPSSDGMVTSSLPPVPSVPVYGGMTPPPISQARYQQPPTYTPASQPVSEPARIVRTAVVPPVQATSTPVLQPTPAVYRPQPEPVYTPPARPAPAKQIRVERGDTLISIARRHNTSVDDIMAANGMTSTRISAGQSLKVPAGGRSATQARTHRVQDGESIYIIADRYNVDYRELAQYNDLSRPDLIRPGQELKIPGAGATQVAAKPRTSEQRGGVRIVRTRTIPVTQVAAKPEPVRVASAGPTVPVPQSSPVRRAEAPAATSKKPDKPVRTARLTEPKPMSGAEFRWPVRGRVISKFGPKANGKHNDGINVAVPAGTSVKAAENGVVAYAGNELEGYGNLVLIRHSDGWVSAYAHNQELLVKRGDTVRRGEIIAKAGQTGSVNQPQLHFELRKGSKPVDPLTHMAQM